MVGLAGALVINIGTLSPPWVEAMLAGRPHGARSEASRSCSTPSAPARRATAPRPCRRLLDEVDVDRPARERGRDRDAGRRRGRGSRRRVDQRRRRAGRAGREAAATRWASSPRSPGPVDHVSDGARALAVANGDELLATVTGTGCMSTAITGCFARRRARRPARGRRRGAGRVRRRRRGRGARARGARALSTPALYDALCNLDPGSLDGRARVDRAVRVHAIVADARDGAERAADGGATVLQLRLKGAPTARRGRAGPPCRELCRSPASPSSSTTTSRPRCELGADGVHLGRDDEGAERRARGRAAARPVRRVASRRRAARERPGAALRRRRAGLGDADEARRGPADRARRAWRRSRARSRSPSSRSAAIDASNAGALHPRPARPAWR